MENKTWGKKHKGPIYNSTKETFTSTRDMEKQVNLSCAL